jgi:2-keto-4-pentenoate hydratase/2-oxohepta-3-ene-1,7-dioic acid hydratase in catechol pathway
MRFATFEIDGCAVPAVLAADGSWRRVGSDSVRAVIETGVRPAADGTTVPEGAQRLAPIPEPRRNIFCVGKNYREHAKEFGQSGFDGGARGGDEVPDEPIVFSKATTSVIGPDAPIPSANDPFASVDYEGELAVVIGTGGHRIAVADAMRHVFGYTIVNDVTSREAQKRHKQWLLGKGVDGFCPIGPEIVTADEAGDPSAMRLVTRVNGEVRQDASVADLIFDIPTLIATISRFVTLLPGDIVATGTPAGVGIGFTPPRYLVAGDTVSVEITGLGTLTNPVS